MVFVAFSLSGFGSCGLSTQEICTQRLLQFGQELDHARVALAASAGQSVASNPGATDSGRAPASVAGVERARGSLGGGVRALSAEESTRWRDWAEERLSEAQAYLDGIEGLREQIGVKRELSDIATSLVSFHGYARQGKTERMARTLETIHSRLDKVRSLSCEPAAGLAPQP